MFNDDGIAPMTFEAFPEKYDDVMFPVMFIVFIMVFAAVMLPVVRVAVSTFAGANTFPTMSIAADDGNVCVTSVRKKPFPEK
ncbi:hypothetical protein NY2A_b053R [Paramecium bursaria Chlorella virus NY2A]|uniref:Uncharacterized protein b053R n=2 Tax=Chlorovirus TaxID=181083 RepID=A7IVS8_PBCVN|nr:hypothetical protein NY2A_b053R [Paramecium bursaria Chlorella virus NY2A]YP_009665223.1 hypothetical protein FK949_gp013 [Paramecium bursaria Chlorella virus NYs1]ABT14452.1 hypothetical protein NY2A_b053R [Paramecium bursaria Chlorella virus NY2A]AGE58578.1 hypothetical protein PBCVNYs1_045R [Paramecium bursaria Chlorella virus NYs1]